MPKLFYTQGTAILFDRAPTLADIKKSLEGIEIAREVPDSNTWQISGPSLVVPYKPEVNGYCMIDIVDQTWPDVMGSPQNGPMTLAAWTMGHFGPFTWPGALERARSQCWNWPEAESIVSAHKAFVRVRHTYAFGAKEGQALRATEGQSLSAKQGQPLVPKDYQPLAELRHALTIAWRIMNVDGAIALFNPNGECLCNSAEVEAALSRSDRTDMQELWCNVRMFNDGRGNLIFDTKGLGQVDLTDHEILVPDGKYDATDIVLFLRNVASYVIANGQAIKDGDTVDGPGGKKWKCKYSKESRLPGPREVIAWTPVKKWLW